MHFETLQLQLKVSEQSVVTQQNSAKSQGQGQKQAPSSTAKLKGRGHLRSAPTTA
jgi:hypothetical protein